MIQTALKESYRVDKLAWAMALGSIFILALIAYLAVTFTVNTYRNLYADKIHEQISARQFKEAQQGIADFFRGPPLLEHFRRSNSVVLHAGQDSALTLLQISESLSAQSLESSARRVDTLRKNLGLVEDFPKPAAAALSPLEQDLSRAAEHEQTLEAAQAKKKELLTQQSSALTEFTLLEKDTSDLFSLPPSNSKTDGFAPLFYQQGMLAGLPKVSRLPDGISSATELREKLSAVGGGVHLGGEDVQSIFNAKLAELRSSGKAIGTTLDQLSQQLADADKSISGLSRQVQDDLDDVSGQSNETIRRFMAGFGR